MECVALRRSRAILSVSAICGVPARAVFDPLIVLVVSAYQGRRPATKEVANNRDIGNLRGSNSVPSDLLARLDPALQARLPS